MLSGTPAAAQAEIEPASAISCQSEVTQARTDGFTIAGLVSRSEHVVIMEREARQARVRADSRR